MGYRGIRAALVATVAVQAVAISGPAWAQAKAFNVPAQAASTGIPELARQADVQILVSETAVHGKRISSVHGTLSIDEALRRALAGTGLRVSSSDGRTITLAPIADERTSSAITDLMVADPAPVEERDVVITGSRIRGAPISSPVLTIDQQQMRDSGQTTLGQVARSIPQSFGGGQNPGIGENVPSANGIDVNGGSSLNLRGLGSDATLTLLDGHRLSYSASRQSIDISVIPLLAVDRLEIVADGASALYGSDAVAGVGNVILKHDFRGIETLAQLGDATDGGYFVQQYGGLAGTDWQNGGGLIAYEYDQNSAIDGRDRSYTRAESPTLTLFPEQRAHHVIASAHQQAGIFTLSVDGLFSWRHSDSIIPLAPVGTVPIQYEKEFNTSRQYAILPSLDARIGRWRLDLTGSYGNDRAAFESDTFSGNQLGSTNPGTYQNAGTSVEFAGDGPLLNLPGGPIGLAVGVGYRNNDFRLIGRSALTLAQSFQHSQASYYAYGELSLPVVKGINGSAALRYERYPGIDDVVTPKLGLTLSPSPDISLKGSWGRSFKAATQYQEYQPTGAVLYPAVSLGAAGAPSSAAALVISGGSPDLRPERAKTWSATIDLHPRFAKRASLQLSYFNVDYTDRVVSPILYLSRSLNDPAYATYVNRAPGEAAVVAAVASAGVFYNSSGAPYDPATVLAIVDDRNVNAGHQTAHGVDVLAQYSLIAATDDTIDMTADAAWLYSRQQLGPGLPETQLAGMLFNPSHFRARGSASWSHDDLTVTGTLSRTGGVTDARTTQALGVGGMTSVDFTARYHIRSGNSPFANCDLSLSANNVLNAKPAHVNTSLYYEAPYDSTNYSPVGRFLSVTISKKW